LAIERYRQAHDNRLPGTLRETVPDFSKALPTDPFDGEPIRYKQLGKAKTQVLEVAYKRTGVFRYDSVPVSEYRDRFRVERAGIQFTMPVLLQRLSTDRLMPLERQRHRVLVAGALIGLGPDILFLAAVFWGTLTQSPLVWFFVSDSYRHSLVVLFLAFPISLGYALIRASVAPCR